MKKKKYMYMVSSGSELYMIKTNSLLFCIAAFYLYINKLFKPDELFCKLIIQFNVKNYHISCTFICIRSDKLSANICMINFE